MEFRNDLTTIYLEDLSANGTYINDELIGRDTKSVLQNGSKVSFAKTGGVYIFEYIQDVRLKEEQKKSFFDEYILGKQLGSGHYATVREARDRRTGLPVAVKIFHPKRMSGEESITEDDKLQQEMELLFSINHKNIVKLISHHTESSSQNFKINYLVLEKMNGGELFQRIVNKLRLRQDETKAIFRQLFSGLAYLHENNIIHRDIKPENVLLDITPRASVDQDQTGPWDPNEYDVKVKIADFGLAKFIGEQKFTNTLCGTPAYVAPEILSNKGNYTTKADLWLSGVLLYVCLCGFPPFSEELAPPNMREQILTGKYAFYSPYWDDIDDLALHLVSLLLQVEPSERPDIEKTREHIWLQEYNTYAFHNPGDVSGNNSQRTLTRQESKPITLREKYSSMNVNSSQDFT